MNETFIDRQEKIRTIIKEKGIHTLLMTSGQNIQYFTGITDPSIQTCGVLILSLEAEPILAVLWLDRLALEPYTEEIRVYTYANPTSQHAIVKKMLLKLEAQKGIIGMDGEALGKMALSIRDSIPNVELVNADDAIALLRSVKSEEEIELIRKACEIAEQGMQVALESLKPGMTELAVANMAEHRMLQLGSDHLKHRTIVASGSRARLIHPFATQKKLEDGDMIAIDLGAVHGGYCSDISRTAVIGRPGEDLKEAFDVLCRLQDAALQKFRPGVFLYEIGTIIKEATKAAQVKLIGPIGHNIGLTVEERPFLLTRSSHRDIMIEKNMVLSIFSGSIQKKQSLGVRLEDTFLVTDSGVEFFTHLPREIFSSDRLP